MFDLPLFPLNTVLFPGMELDLRIFEDRYKIMINECITSDKPFGVVLIKRGVEAYGSSEPYLVGCTARIKRIEQVEGDNLHIRVVGQERFRIYNLKNDRPYLIGQVETMAFIDTNFLEVARYGRRLRTLLQTYLDQLKQIGKLQFNTNQIPKDPKTLAYLASIILKTDNHKKQELLASEKTAVLLERLIKLYRIEIVLLKSILAMPNARIEQSGPFSLN